MRPIRQRRPLVASVLVAGTSLGIAAPLVGVPAAFAAGHAKNPPPAVTHFLASLRSEEHATFTATYAISSGGKAISLTYDHNQADSKVLLPGGQTIFELGATTYWCYPSPHPFCSKLGSMLAVPFVALFSPSVIISQVQSTLVLQGVTIRTSQKTFAGQHALCIESTSARYGSGSYCTTSEVLAYAGKPGSSITLTRFSSSAPASLFHLPAGATVGGPGTPTG